MKKFITLSTAGKDTVEDDLLVDVSTIQLIVTNENSNSVITLVVEGEKRVFEVEDSVTSIMKKISTAKEV